MYRSTEQSTFAAIIGRHVADGCSPLLLEGGVGIGKTRAYLSALIQSGKQIAVVLPTHQLIDQLLASSDLAATRGAATIAAFRPARMFDRRAEYEANKIATSAAQVMLCTAASVIIDHRLGGEYNGATSRDFILFDEADQLPDMAALQSDFTITAAELSDLGIRLTTVDETLRLILAKPPRVVEPETRAAARIILDAIEEPAWYQSAGMSDDGDIMLTHKLPGRLLKKISNRGNVAFISATLTVGGRFKDFQNSMAIDAISPLSCAIEPERHGTLDFTMIQMEVDTPEWIAAVTQAAKAAPKPALVATTSHDLSALLGEQLPGAVVRTADETAAQAAARIASDGTLISAGAWAGLDTPIRWRSIVVPRVPYGQPVVIDGEATTSYFDARNTAVRRLRQVIGRGLRTPDAVCSIVIVDARAEKLTGFIPERFAGNWAARTFLEGGRKEVVLSKAERDPAVRRAALNHYGRKCMNPACGFIPKVDSQLDVHHLDPIAEGQRRTRIEDVAVLCANCHRLAHATEPPTRNEDLPCR
jgi:Rad3-related DNA helicase